MGLRVVQFLAVLLTALALVPSGAHLFELPNKIDLARDAYLTVQGIYAGWGALRQEWEYSHAASAMVLLVAICSVTLSVITTKRD
jgi:hypothetical protein